MISDTAFDPEMIRRHGGPGPRYTSYPSALQFAPSFGAAEYRAAVERSIAARPAAPLSAYVHIPFCSSPCFYCGCNRVITRQWGEGAAYLKRLEREIEMHGALLGPGRVIEQLHLGGGTPTFLNIDQLGCLMGSLERTFGLAEAEEREFSIEIDPRTIHADMIAELAGLGFNRVSLGVQDFDPQVQQAVNRVQTIKDTLDLIEQARACGMRSVSVDLIYGLPKQTLLSWEHTLDIIAAARPDRVAAYGYAHLPQRFKAQGRIDPAHLPSAEDRLRLLELTVRRLTAAGYVYIGMDHFALPGDELARALRDGRLQRNFQGYSTRAGLDLLGLGMSAIGSMDDTYSQNARRLDHYYEAIDAGRLPVEGGLRLSADDQLRREVIMALMCQGFLRYADIEARHGLRFAEYFSAELARLRALAVDGLVRVGADTIEVTPAGRFLVRAVAMCFDAYLQPANTEAPRHSAVI